MQKTWMSPSNEKHLKTLAEKLMNQVMQTLNGRMNESLNADIERMN